MQIAKKIKLSSTGRYNRKVCVKLNARVTEPQVISSGFRERLVRGQTLFPVVYGQQKQFVFF